MGVFDLRMLGLGPGISYRNLHRLVPIGVLGYAINVLTGTMFLSSAPDQYLYNPAFQTKLGFMMLAGCNVIWFYTTCSTEVRTTSDSLPVTGRAKLIGTVSCLPGALSSRAVGLSHTTAPLTTGASGVESNPTSTTPLNSEALKLIYFWRKRDDGIRNYTFGSFRIRVNWPLAACIVITAATFMRLGLWQ